MILTATFFLTAVVAMFLVVLFHYGILLPYQQWSGFFDRANKLMDLMIAKVGEEE